MLGVSFPDCTSENATQAILKQTVRYYQSAEDEKLTHSIVCVDSLRTHFQILRRIITFFFLLLINKIHVLTSISLICIRPTIQPCVITTPPMCKFISVASLLVIIIVMLHFQNLFLLQRFHSLRNRASYNMTLVCNFTVARKAFACNAISALEQTAQHIEFNRCKI